MTKFSFELGRDATQFAWVTVEADTFDEACEKAIEADEARWGEFNDVEESMPFLIAAVEGEHEDYNAAVLSSCDHNRQFLKLPRRYQSFMLFADEPAREAPAILDMLREVTKELASVLAIYGREMMSAHLEGSEAVRDRARDMLARLRPPATMTADKAAS